MKLSRSSSIYVNLRLFRNKFNLFLKQLSAVDGTSYIHQTANISKDLRAEEYVFVGKNCDLSPQVSLGRYSMLASNVSIIGGDHVSDKVGIPMQFTGRPEQLATTIQRDVWVGRNAIILRGITIGEGAIVAAGAIVTKDVLPYTVVGGVPARFIRNRFNNENDEKRHADLINGELILAKFAEPQE